MGWPRFSGFHNTPNDAHLQGEGDLWISYERGYFSNSGEYGVIESYPSSLHALIVVGDAKDLEPVKKAAEKVVEKRRST